MDGDVLQQLAVAPRRGGLDILGGPELVEVDPLARRIVVDGKDIAALETEE